MESEDKFWFGVCSLVLTGVITISLCTMSYWKHYTTEVGKMLASGVSPLEVVCALQDEIGNNPTCIIMATNANGKKQTEDE